MVADDMPIPGLVWAYHFRSGRPPYALDADTTAPRDLSADGFVWLHLALSDARLTSYLPGLGLAPEDACRALLARDRHLSLSAARHAIVGVMPDFRVEEFGGRKADYDRFRFLITERFLITARSHPLRAMAAVRQEIEAGRSFEAPADLFGALSEAFELSIGAMVESCNDSLDAIEEEVFNLRRGKAQEGLGAIRRDLIQVHRILRTTARLFHRVDQFHAGALEAGTLAVFEQRAHHFAALDQDVMSLEQRARLLHEEIESRLQSQTNRNLYILSVATSVLLPPTLVTGYFGMNVKDMPFTETPHGVLYATFLVILSGVAAAYVLRRLGIGPL
jgi:zinc transporter